MGWSLGCAPFIVQSVAAARPSLRSAAALAIAGFAGAAFADSIPPSSPGPAPLSVDFGLPRLARSPDPSSPPNPAPFALPQLAAPQFRADASAPPSAAKAAPAHGAFLDLKGQNLLGDMGGLRPALDKYGVQLTILENVETFGNLSGRRQTGF